MSDNLPALQNTTLTRPIWPALSPALEALLTEPGGIEGPARDIAERPALHAEAKQALAELEAVATFPADEAGIKRVIGARFVLFPPPMRSETEWTLWWADYIDVCGKLPEEALQAGMRAWIAKPDAEFMPKPGVLLDLARKATTPAGMAYSRASRAAALSCERLRPAMIHVETPALRGFPKRSDRQEVANMAAELRTKLAETATTSRPVKPHDWRQTPTDERGLSDAMRIHLAQKVAAE